MVNQVKSKWKVSSNPIRNARTIYQVFRIKDVNQVHHSGNREEYGKSFADKSEAEALAEKLNSEVESI